MKRIFFIISLVLFSFFSCNKSSFNEKVQYSLLLSEIESIELLDANSPIVNDLKTSLSFYPFIDKLKLNKIQLIEFYDNPVRTLNIPFEESSVLILFLIPGENISQGLIYEKEQIDNDYKITISSLEREEMITSISDKEGKLLEFSVIETKNIVKGEDTIELCPDSSRFCRCFKGAYSACMDDSECAILCGFTYPFCVSSIAAACLKTELDFEKPA